MRKLLFFITFGIFVPQAVLAQYDFKQEDEEFFHHQVNVNGATTTWGLLFRNEGDLKWKTDSLHFNGHSTPALQFAYDYYFIKNLSLGVLLSTQNMKMDIGYLVFKNANEQTRRFNDFSVDVRRRYMGLRLFYHFINNANSDFYMGIRYGGVYWKMNPSITDSDLDKKFETSFTGTLAPSIGIGYKFKIKERWGIGLETGIGTPQIFSYGVDFRF